MSSSANIAAYRFLANYDLQRVYMYDLFNNNDTTYWLFVWGMFLLYSFLNFVKVSLFYYTVLTSNLQIHSDMISKLMKSPIRYFDYTPSGQIISKFSNDFGVMDQLFAFSAVNTL